MRKRLPRGRPAPQRTGDEQAGDRWHRGSTGHDPPPGRTDQPSKTRRRPARWLMAIATATESRIKTMTDRQGARGTCRTSERVCRHGGSAGRFPGFDQARFRGEGQPAITQDDRRPEPAAPASGVSILSGEGGERRQFASLKAACSAARNNDVIELQYDGPHEQEPLELTNLKLTIRAGGGFRPVMVFRPGQLRLAGFGRSMITVTGGRLTLLNVGLELDIVARGDRRRLVAVRDAAGRAITFRGLLADDSQRRSRRRRLSRQRRLFRDQGLARRRHDDEDAGIPSAACGESRFAELPGARRGGVRPFNRWRSR